LWSQQPNCLMESHWHRALFLSYCKNSCFPLESSKYCVENYVINHVKNSGDRCAEIVQELGSLSIRLLWSRFTQNQCAVIAAA
jgi:hypothetical protein